MGVTSVSLPKWKGKEKVSDSEIGTYDKATLKYKKITDYTKAVNGNYKTLRNIITGFDLYPEYIQLVQLGTHNFSYIRIIDQNGNIGRSDIYNLSFAVTY